MTPKETVLKYWEAWSDHNFNNLLTLLSPGFVSRSSLSHREATSKHAIALGFKMFDEALPDLKEEIISIMAENNHVACEVVETATFTGAMELPTGVIAPTNRHYKIPVASFFRIDDQGQIIEQRTYLDTASLAQQMGIDLHLFTRVFQRTSNRKILSRHSPAA